MKKFEILWDFPKCDRHTKRANAVGKLALKDLLDTGLHKPSICKKHSVCKAQENKAQ